jgi:hypothetical protein
MGSSLIAVGFGSSIKLLSCGFSFRHDGGEDGRLEEEEGGGEAGKHALLIKLRAWRMGFHALEYLPVGSTKARQSGCAGGEPKRA